MAARISNKLLEIVSKFGAMQERNLQVLRGRFWNFASSSRTSRDSSDNLGNFFSAIQIFRNELLIPRADQQLLLVRPTIIHVLLFNWNWNANWRLKIKKLFKAVKTAMKASREKFSRSSPRQKLSPCSSRALISYF